jgi:hypothetical protein
MPRTFLTRLVEGQPIYLTRTKERMGREQFVKSFPETQFTEGHEKTSL